MKGWDGEGDSRHSCFPQIQVQGAYFQKTGESRDGSTATWTQEPAWLLLDLKGSRAQTGPCRYSLMHLPNCSAWLVRPSSSKEFRVPNLNFQSVVPGGTQPRSNPHSATKRTASPWGQSCAHNLIYLTKIDVRPGREEIAPSTPLSAPTRKGGLSR